jgi:hypothetical protein
MPATTITERQFKFIVNLDAVDAPAVEFVGTVLDIEEEEIGIAREWLTCAILEALRADGNDQAA